MSRLPAEPWVRNQYVMVATVFVVFTGFAFVLPFLPLYVRKLGVQGDETVALWAGVLVGVAPLIAGLMAPVWGRLADRHGQKRIVLRALVSYVFLLALSAAVTRVEHLLVLRMGVGFFGGIGPLGLAMATSLVPRDQTGRAVGLIQAAQILAAAVGPLTGGYLADTIGIRSTFLVTAGLCAGALWLVARYYQEGSPTATARAPTAPPASAGPLLRQRGVLSLLVVLFLVNFVGRSFTPILPLQLQRLAVPAASLGLATGVLISAYSVAAAVSSTVLGRATGRFPPRALLAASLAAGAATVLPMALISSFTTFLALALLLGLASGGALTICYTIGGLMVPSPQRATAFGFFSGAALFGGAISPTVAGLLAHWELRGIYYLDTVLFVLLTAGLLATGVARASVPSRAGEA
jgi:MFS transporter, DHA1 family, multidrug resistance protein